MLENICRVAAPDGRSMMQMNITPAEVDAGTWHSAVHRNQDHLQTVGGNHTVGSIGCALGHGLAWEHVQRTQVPFALIMEDDITDLHEGLMNFLVELVQARQDQWGVLQMQFNSEERKINNAQQISMIRGGRHNTGLYAIRPEVARQALKGQFPITEKQRQIDDPDEFLRKQTDIWRTDPLTALQLGASLDTDAQILLQFDAQEDDIRPCKPLISTKMVKPGLQAFKRR
eukprot:TRINITY_DN72944_c0_g1_i2.p1 TRINITY_DN72944_c0_g1~~TRINITY_DN72944_c0_g1_i2.p1  ORF type:complete len:229 (-),score=17.73 TRINITY_DN72944_c0_g1_i2:107-793(-)